MRGQGRVFQRGNRWWLAYWVRGKEFRESGGNTKADAKRKLKARLGEINEGSFTGLREERITVNQLLDDFILYLETKGAKSLNTFQSYIKPVRRVFGTDRVIEITTARIQKFILEMKKEGFANATINRRTGALKQAFNLARKQEILNRVPYIPMLREDNARQGFFESDEFEAIVRYLPDPLNDITRFAYFTGWRKGEILPLKWENIDRLSGEIRLLDSKNGQGRVIPIEGPLKELIEKRWQVRGFTLSNGNTAISSYVFHRKGNPYVDTRKAWKTACEKAGYPGKLIHDLRRTAARNFTRAGVPETVAMSITGHKTTSMFQRYNITSQEDQRKALIATQEHVSSLPSEKRIVSLSSGAHKK